MNSKSRRKAKGRGEAKTAEEAVGEKVQSSAGNEVDNKAAAIERTEKNQARRRLQINDGILRSEFMRDRDFDEPQYESFVDRDTGDILRVCDDDGDAKGYWGVPAKRNRDLRKLVKSDPKRFIGIPVPDHTWHHDTLREFLASNWTDGEKKRSDAAARYHGSIGGWLEIADDDARDAYLAYREKTMERAMETFLSDNGIEPEWV